MKIYVPMYQFIVLAVSTAVMTYFFNSFFIGGQYFLSIFFGAILVRNLYASYQLSRFIKLLEKQVKDSKEK